MSQITEKPWYYCDSCGEAMYERPYTSLDGADYAKFCSENCIKRFNQKNRYDTKFSFVTDNCDHYSNEQLLKRWYSCY
jgi:hypothetical protein